MGSLFRSELMSLCQLFLQSEAAYNCVSELGELGTVQFKDLNPNVNAFQRRFVNEVRRCDEMERKLRFLEKEILKEMIPILDTGDNPDPPKPREMIDLETTFEKLENELKEVNKNAEALKKTYSELIEFKYLLSKTQLFFEEVEAIQKHDMQDMPEDTHKLIEDDSRGGHPSTKLGFVAGVIRRERIPGFELMLWRVCRGNVFLRQTVIEFPIQDPHTGEGVIKSVFIIFFQGDQLKSKIKKICEGFRATIYPCPEDAFDRREMTVNIATRVDDLNMVLAQTMEHRHRVLFASAKNIKNWLIKLRKMKAIYHTMNQFNFDVTQKALIAECWCADQDLPKVRHALRVASDRSGSSMPCILNRMDTSETPPTYNRTNKFTIGFQNIVDSYGVADYREVNPAPFTIITFPFLFAVMFGDAGHGVLMFLFALWMVLKERSLEAQKSTNEIWLTFFNGRYIILLMGSFSIYTGLMYNDVYSKAFNFFGTAWTTPTYDPSIKDLSKYQLNPAIHLNDTLPYPFGIDPIWQLSDNKIVFLNSYKMKLSVILGVGQMLFGVSLSYFNHNYFRKPLNIICEFVPQVIFLMAIFGYMNGMIFAKWIVFDSTKSNKAPSILINLINMFLMKYPEEEGQPEYLDTWYTGQKTVQTILLLCALLCIPWMLVVKPIVLNSQNKKRVREEAHNTPIIVGDDTAVLVEASPASGDQHGGHGGHGEKFDLGDVIIHQSIHTIEYCLGSISHTASYLRLWALSLAHAELSEVLWTMVMQIGLKHVTGNDYINAVIMFVIFAFWATLTVCVLLVMEGLSAFLHALRLHWVEFQSKFYIGSGYIFEPYSFKVILELAEKDTEAAAP